MTELLAVILALCGGPAPVLSHSPATAARRPATAAMTLRQLIGQRMVLAYDGLEPPPGLRLRIRRGEAAGVIVFARNIRSVPQLRATVRGLQAIPRPPGTRVPLLVMTDQESGPVRRIPGAPADSAAQTHGAGAARADGRATARTLRAAGVNSDLAPVADVGRPGAALVRERRTHGRSPRAVSRLASSFAAGLHDGRVRATAKHYPGLGAARVNTDAAPQRIDASLAQLRAIDEPPFASLIAAGVDAVMLASAVYPALDERPAALSPAWVRGELRGRLGFRGVTISDDLQTPALSAYGSIPRRAVLAARAGIDLPLFAGDYRSGALAAAGLLAAARRGELPRAELEAAALRVLALRRRLGGR